MNELTDPQIQALDEQIIKFMSKPDIQEKISDLIKTENKRLDIDIDKLREFDADLTNTLIKYPLKLIPLFQTHLNGMASELKGEKAQQRRNNIVNKKEAVYQVNFVGKLGRNMVSPRGLTAELSNQYVGVQGIVTRVSLVRPKLVYSVHYCEATKQGTIKEYIDQMGITTNSELLNNNINGNIEGKAGGYLSNTVPKKNINSNPLTFEYVYSKFKDHQVILVQEPPERTPVGQLPRSIEIILEEDLVDKVKPGDRVQVTGVFKCISSQSTNFTGIVRTILIATSVESLNKEATQPEFVGEDIRNFKTLGKKQKVFEILANSIAPGIYGHQFIKKALILQLLGGCEKNLENGTHLRGDINILMIGDPSTAKSQFLRHMLSIAPNAINTTGRGSSGVGLTAAVVVDPDTGERHLEAGAMVLGDRGVVCIDEFDKMSEVDRVAIHEVMEQQTVTIAKAGIHVSLNSRCSVLAAANPIYGQYITDIPAARNIGFPDSLLSRFDLCFVVLDEHNSELDRKISERVINNHMFTVDAPNVLNDTDDQVIEPEVKANENQKKQVYEKYNPHLHGGEKKQILTRNFLRNYLYYARNTVHPVLTDEARNFIDNSWSQLREKASLDSDYANKYKIVPITVRTLETLVRLSTAHAKARLSDKVEKEDAIEAFELLTFALYNETEEESEESNEMEIDDKPKKTKKKREEEEEEVVEEKRSKRKKKKPEEEFEEELDDLIKAEPEKKDTDFPDETKKFVYKMIYDNAKRDGFQTIKLDNLWNIIKLLPDAKRIHKITSKSKLFDIVAILEEEEKIFISEEKEITLV